MSYYIFDEATYRPLTHAGPPADAHIRLALSRPLVRKMGVNYQDLPVLPAKSADAITVFARTVGDLELLAKIDGAETALRSPFPTFEFDEQPVDYGVVILLNFNSEMIDQAMQTVGWRFYQAPRELTKQMTD
jgi:hypothetical protein